jgi:hypothetical protein
MKVDKAEMMERYNKWLNQKPGFTRSTMTRKEYSKMMKLFSENNLRRNNFAISVKDYESEKAYRNAKAQWMRQWRKKAFPGGQSEHQTNTIQSVCETPLCNPSLCV